MSNLNFIPNCCEPSPQPACDCSCHVPLGPGVDQQTARDAKKRVSDELLTIVGVCGVAVQDLNDGTHGLRIYLDESPMTDDDLKHLDSLLGGVPATFVHAGGPFEAQ